VTRPDRSPAGIPHRLRVHSLLGAVLSVGRELELRQALYGIVEAATALGVIGAGGRRLSAFCAVGRSTLAASGLSCGSRTRARRASSEPVNVILLPSGAEPATVRLAAAGAPAGRERCTDGSGATR